MIVSLDLYSLLVNVRNLYFTIVCIEGYISVYSPSLHINFGYHMLRRHPRPPALPLMLSMRWCFQMLLCFQRFDDFNASLIHMPMRHRVPQQLGVFGLLLHDDWPGRQRDVL